MEAEVALGGFWQAVLVWWYWQHMVVGLNPRGGVNVLQVYEPMLA